VTTFGNYPSAYLAWNAQKSKQLALVLQIDGIDTLFGLSDTYTRVRYGDPGLVYGMPGLLYGSLRATGAVKPFLQIDSGLTIQQRIEPESGKGNIGTITLSLVDYNGEVSALLSPSAAVPEIMGRLCTLYLGFAQTSYPEDYVIVYRGNITQIQCPPGLVKLQISDSTNKARQPVFAFGSTSLGADIAATASSPITVTLANTGVLPPQILGPDGTYDPEVTTYFTVDSEIFQYGPTGILSATQVLCTRAVLGSDAADHTLGASVTPSVGFGQAPNSGIDGLEFSLKLLLSGWDGPCISDVALSSIGIDGLDSLPTSFVLSTQDAFFNLGISVGDFFYISGSAASGNNVSGMVTGLSTGPTGRVSRVQTNVTFPTVESSTSALVAFRSQYDTFPVSCGAGCSTAEVDVETYQAIDSNYFATAGSSSLRLYYDSPSMAKDTIDGDVNLPLGCYGVSRYGRISLAITKPPLPGSGSRIVQLDYTNVLDPDKIVTTRATNQRSFYNVISYEYDYDILNQAYQSIQYFVDTESAGNFNQTTILPIQAQGIKTSLGGAAIASARGTALLNRFKNCLVWIELTVNWSVGSLIEVSDVVVLVDNGQLQIMNYATGERNLGVQLFEVIDRTYQIVTGNVRLKLLGGLGFDIFSRFGLVSPSSSLNSGCTTSALRILPSFGQSDNAHEIAKWTPLLGQGIQVHAPDWSVTGSSVLQGVSPTDPTALLISPALGFTPASGYILDIAPYPASTAASVDALLKALYCHVSPSILIASGTSVTQFTVVSGASEIVLGTRGIVRNTDYSVQSPETIVQAVSGSTVTMASSLGFVPSAGQYLEGLGYPDGTGYYRID